MTTVTIPRAAVPLTADGRAISREWYRWAHDLTIRAGGVDGSGSDDLSLSQFEDAGIEELKAQAYAIADEFRQAPPTQVLLQTLDVVQTEIAQLVAEVATLRREIEDLKQGATP